MSPHFNPLRKPLMDLEPCNLSLIFIDSESIWWCPQYHTPFSPMEEACVRCNSDTSFRRRLQSAARHFLNCHEQAEKTGNCGPFRKETNPEQCYQCRTNPVIRAEFYCEMGRDIHREQPDNLLRLQEEREKRINKVLEGLHLVLKGRCEPEFELIRRKTLEIIANEREASLKGISFYGRTT